MVVNISVGIWPEPSGSAGVEAIRCLAVLDTGTDGTVDPMVDSSSEMGAELPSAVDVSFVTSSLTLCSEISGVIVVDEIFSLPTSIPSGERVVNE